MSRDKRYFDPESEWHGFEDCDKCPGADRGPQVPDENAPTGESCPNCK